MSNTTDSSNSILWQGRPWITPAAVARSVVFIIVGFIFVWIEFYTKTANDLFFGVNIVIWTILAFLVIWLISLTGLLVQRATNAYALRNDSLEITTGILTSRSSVIVASGFSDLEVIRGVVGRIFGYGDVIIRTQSERDPEKTMMKVRDPLKVGEQIRYVMGRPMVRLEPKPEAKP